MIKGIGVDVVDINRFLATLNRVPELRNRLFTPAERELPPASLAARFAVKEAIAKALGSPGGMRWHDCEVTRTPQRPPQVRITGTVERVAQQQGITAWHVSISHDGGIATAFVIGEG
ncbi:MAG TPA: holo-ACP synthase [Beutenbergiaceae bacterium]|nr:holo-ACP synthase [Beutenbergiaceae bacterium]